MVRAAGFERQEIQNRAVKNPDPTLQYHLATNASLTGAGGVLFQVADQPTGTEITDKNITSMRILMFMPFRFSDAETRYVTGERETLGIVKSLAECRWLIPATSIMVVALPIPENPASSQFRPGYRMERQVPQEFILEAFTDPASIKDVVRGILHTIFFHRFFPSLSPRSREVLDITLPFVDDAELDTMIEGRATELARELDAERTHSHSSGPNVPLHHHPSQLRGGGGGGGGGAPAANSNGGRGNISIQFFEKKRRKAWFMGVGGGDEEVCWESWTVKVTVAEPRTESERAKVRRAMEQTLLAAAMKIVTYVNTHKDHIPPITTSETNPFPYQINVNKKDARWATRMGIY
ncbi:hypothetical protein GGR51DRAFT_555786 [Nemania sp. FL0031]|nr:hypothetical protein GGR51DRAFT_555786 [Nemania sp. FL0031]